MGINWVFAPVADLDVLPENPIVQTRAFGDDPQRVATPGPQLDRGLPGRGRPGLRQALSRARAHRASTRHVTLPVVDADRETLQGSDLVPFTVAVESGVASMMTAHVAYPALDASGTAGHALGADHGRAAPHRLGFDGLVVTDALIMDGALIGRRESDAAVEALQSGVDLLLYPKDPRRVLEAALEQAVDERRPDSRARLAAVAPPLRARARGRDQPDAAGHAAVPSTRPSALADALLEPGHAARRRARAHAARSIWWSWTTIVGGPYPPSPSDWAARALGPELVGRYDRRIAGGAGVRGAAGMEGPVGLRRGVPRGARDPGRDADLVVLFGHPRLVEQIPSDAPVLLAWHRQRLMQEAVARWLRGAG